MLTVTAIGGVGVDSQQIELVGRGLVIESLARGAVEVAQPLRDRGIDLVAYFDESPRFAACPLQLKVSSARAFGLDAKYGSVPSLLLVYVWNADDRDDSVILALTFAEALAVCDDFGWTSKPSWINGKRWQTNKPSKALVNKLMRYRIGPEQWRDRIEDALGAS